ncbi:uncharacterized protein LOC134101272 [Sardina pilchardus]|uniref:uncharacterized protein LOC134101272 n=1 Tax=Sardina pilchardus TaxID=27697 RepID=UPI002E0F466F
MRAVVLLLLVAVASAKQFEMEELAKILKRHGMDNYKRTTLGDWLCLIEHESNYDTQKQNTKKNKDGSTDYGLFQINNRHWCDDGTYRPTSNGCKIRCSELLKDDIQDAINCAKHIVSEHKGGLHAWVAWVNKCKGKDMSRYVPDQSSVPDTSCCPVYIPSSALLYCTILWMNSYCNMRAVVLLLLLVAFASAKRYGKGEIANILRRAGMDGFQGISLANWMCLIEHESQYDSEAKNPYNSDGSTDYGIFQINNRFWCKDPNFRGDGNGCGVSCSDLVRDINTSINCAKTVVSQSRDGIGAWVAWRNKCQGKDLSSYVRGI